MRTLQKWEWKVVAGYGGKNLLSKNTFIKRFTRRTQFLLGNLPMDFICGSPCKC